MVDGRNMKSHYDVLGVTSNASKDDIKKAYRKLCMKYHPDLSNSTSTTNLELFKQISSAHSVLSDDAGRKMYDYELEQSQIRNPFRRNPTTHSTTDGFSNQQHRGGSSGYSRKHSSFGHFLDGIYRPRNMFWGTIIGFSIIAFFKPFSKKSMHDSYDTQGGGKLLVDAWYNPKTNQYEQPAPWNPEFRKLNPAIVKVNRENVKPTKL